MDIQAGVAPWQQYKQGAAQGVLGHAHDLVEKGHRTLGSEDEGDEAEQADTDWARKFIFYQAGQLSLEGRS